ncbi:SRPBCC domain-containing protein [Candidatus Leptofilum sp.]|uniref:SRPBCC domain-containing protein n=1 Tax=Candidatus Leptofilum sp. TaxID=3241576 RepID=UPI003B5CA34F
MTENVEQTVIQKSVTVRCNPTTAFHIWTKEISLWWPKRHSMSGDLETAVTIEGIVGGRIYEETPNGTTYLWGEVVAWEPPHYFAYNWYLGSGAQLPSRVEIRFTPLETTGTKVEVFHRGPELIGNLWIQRKDAFAHAWEHVLPCYLQACEENS